MKKIVLIIIIALVAVSAFAQEGYVQLPADSTGKKLRMRQSTQGANTVHSQGFFLDDGNGSGPLGVASNPIFAQFASQAMADGVVNPTIPQFAAFGMFYNGSTWDRLRGDTTNGIFVNVKAIGAPVEILTGANPDFDTTAGEQNVASVGIVLPSATGPVIGGTSSNPLNVEFTGAQPVVVSSDDISAPVFVQGSTGVVAFDLASKSNQTDGSQKAQVVNGANALAINGSGQAAIQNPPNIDTALSTRATETTLSNVDTHIQATQPRDVTDRAARQLGVIYGSGGAAIKQTAVNNNTAIEIFVGASAIDPRQVTTQSGSVTSATIAADSVGLATQTTLALIKAKTDNIPADPSREGGVLATAAKQDTGNASLSSIDTKLTSEATALNQTTQITSEQSIDSKIPSLRNGALPVVVIATARPVLTAQQMSNPLLYRAAMNQFCSMNLCAPTPLGR